MKLEKALEILQLQEGATREDIKSAYRARALELHRDRGGDDAAMAQLNEAYAVALEHAIGPSTDLVPVETAAALVRAVEALPARQEREEASQRVIRQLVGHQVTPLQAAMRQRAALAILAGGLSAIGILYRTTAFDRLDTALADQLIFISVILGILAVVLAVFAWQASTRAAIIRGALEDAGEVLADKAAYLDSMVEIREAGGLGDSWSRAELEQAVDRWSGGYRGRITGTILRQLSGRPRQIPLITVAAQTGPTDFARLIIAKGGELELLDEAAERRDGRMTFRYSLTLPDA